MHIYLLGVYIFLYAYTQIQMRLIMNSMLKIVKAIEGKEHQNLAYLIKPNVSFIWINFCLNDFEAVKLKKKKMFSNWHLTVRTKRMQDEYINK